MRAYLSSIYRVVYVLIAALTVSQTLLNEAFAAKPAPKVPPIVTLTSPSDGATYTEPATISLAATATDSDGTVSKVEFFQGTTLIASVATSPYTYNWTGVPAGSYSVTAKATDNSGLTATSPAANISVVASGSAPPTVVLTSPSNGATYTEPATISLAATATDSDGTVSKVEFFQGATLIASVTTSPYTYEWTGVAAGSYSIEAKVTDNSGLTATSSPASVTVNSSGPTPPPGVVGDVNYSYDEGGRLVSVVDAQGNAAGYSYDAVGNVLAISRYTSSQVAILEFTPNSGTAGSTVLISGAGFAATPAGNTVKFNGTTATVTAASTTQLTVQVPTGATTGMITVASANGIATSSTAFTVAAPSAGPQITSFTPMVGTSGTAVAISGSGFDASLALNRVKFGDGLGAASNVTASSISATAPAGFHTGKISVATPNGVATSAQPFVYVPIGYALSNVESVSQMHIGETKTVSIATSGNIALVTFDGKAGQKVSLLISNLTFSSSWFNFSAILGPDGSTLRNGFLNFFDAVTLPVDGTYTIAFDANYAVGSASLALSEVVDITSPITVDGPPATVTTTVPGQNVNLTFSGVAGQRVSMQVTNLTIVRVDAIAIVKPDGTTLASGGFIDGATLPVDGTYHVFIDPGVDAVGSATVTLYTPPADVTGAISADGTATTVTTTSVGQNARLTFTGVAGQRVALAFESPNLHYYTMVYIVMPDGTTLASGRLDWGFIDTVTLPVGGTYTLFADMYDTSVGSLTLNLYTVPADAEGAILTDGTPATVTTTVPGQNARLTFNGAAGQRVSLVVSNLGAGSGLTIVKPDGTTLVSGSSYRDFDNYPLYFYIDVTTLPVDGTYSVFVDFAKTQVGSPTLALYTVPPDVTGAIVADGTPMPVTTTVPGQNARLTFNGSAGQRVSLAFSNLNLYYRSTIAIVKPDGTTLASQLVYQGYIDATTLPVDGTYSVFVDFSRKSVGSVTLSLYTVPPDVTASTDVNAVAETLTTTIPGQNAKVTFSGAASQQITVRVTANSMGSTTVSLVKPDGTTQTSSASSAINFNLTSQTLATTGMYTVLVNPSGTNIGSISIQVTSP